MNEYCYGTASVMKSRDIYNPDNDVKASLGLVN